MLWVGIRAEKLGRGAKILIRAGFMRQKAAALNNRTACDFIYPCGKKTLADFAELFKKLSAAGFQGIAFQWTDLQWKHNADLTDKQWQARKMIDAE